MTASAELLEGRFPLLTFQQGLKPEEIAFELLTDRSQDERRSGFE